MANIQFIDPNILTTKQLYEAYLELQDKYTTLQNINQELKKEIVLFLSLAGPSLLESYVDQGKPVKDIRKIQSHIEEVKRLALL